MEATSVVLYVDPVCPFAWITSRWLAEVESVRPVEAEFRVMSLAVLNEHRELEPWYREFNDRAWWPARVGATVQREGGPAAFRAFYQAFGEQLHGRGERDHARALAAAVAAVDLPDLPGRPDLSDLPDRLSSADQRDADAVAQADAVLRVTHDRVAGLVGEELGTPVVVLAGAAFFGPVSTRIARGEEAGRQFDAVRLLAGCPGFSELKRARTDALSFA